MEEVGNGVGERVWLTVGWFEVRWFAFRYVDVEMSGGVCDGGEVRMGLVGEIGRCPIPFF